MRGRTRASAVRGLVHRAASMRPPQNAGENRVYEEKYTPLAMLQ